MKRSREEETTSESVLFISIGEDASWFACIANLTSEEINLLKPLFGSGPCDRQEVVLRGRTASDPASTDARTAAVLQKIYEYDEEAYEGYGVNPCEQNDTVNHKGYTIVWYWTQ